MTILKELEQMKQSLETLAQERSKIEGKREGLMDQLKALGFTTLEEGQAEVIRLKAVREAAEAEAAALLESFREIYKEFL